MGGGEVADGIKSMRSGEGSGEFHAIDRSDNIIASRSRIYQVREQNKLISRVCNSSRIRYISSHSQLSNDYDVTPPKILCGAFLSSQAKSNGPSDTRFQRSDSKSQIVD